MSQHFNYVVVETKHPLSRFKSQNLRICQHRTSSIEMGFAHLMLRQQGLLSLDHKLRHNNRLHSKPTKIVPWLRRHGFSLPPEWILRADDVYLDIMVHEMGNVGGYFRVEFFKEVDRMDDPDGHSFACCGSQNEWVLSSGGRFSSMQVLQDRDEKFSGFNLYGTALRRLLKMHLSGSFVSSFGVDRLHGIVPIDLPKFKNTVLVLSDSMARQVQSVDGGQVISISGGTFGDLAEEVDVRGIRFDDYAVVIISCGINDAQRDLWQQDRSWRSMETVLWEQSAGSGATKFLVSLPFPQSSVPSAKPYSEWIEGNLSDSNIDCLNWFKLEKHKFITDGQPNHFLFDLDMFHVNHQGFREMWIQWAEVVDALKRVKFELTAVRFNIKRDHEGNIVLRV